MMMLSHRFSYLRRHQQRYLVRNLSSISVGILRETYDKWERRAPLSPKHVSEFLSSHKKAKVIVQPSCQRIFADKEYEQAGATVQEDLRQANVIIGVKRPQSLEGLPANSTCMFFSHVIKGQPENMDLLAECLEKRVHLIDYECIHQEMENSKKKRLVAFGKYAGLAGMIDTWSVLGRRLLGTHSTSTPFLNCPPTVYHRSLEAAQASVLEMGNNIAKHGLPGHLGPVIICVTGTGGNVHSGVRAILELLPHEMVRVKDLPELMASAASAPESNYRQIYVVAPELHELYQHKSGENFDRETFFSNPQYYNCTFADSIAPYCQVLMNCIYWDERFPRILTKEDMLRLHELGKNRLMIISDISCDINGSIEFLDRSTTIDNPCYEYDPMLGRECAKAINHGVTMMGVDILPTELPVESSAHFGNAVSDVLIELASCIGYDDVVDNTKLSPRLKNATITSGGNLSPNFKYLKSIMKRTMKQPKLYGASKSMTILMEGHLFDSGLINQVLDVLEANNCGFDFKECIVEPKKTSNQPPVKSKVILGISGDEKTDLKLVERKIVALVSAIEKADASYRFIDESQNNRAYVKDQQEKRVLLLGSGRVSKSVVDLLGRSIDRSVTVVSNNEKEARDIATFANRGQHFALDIANDLKLIAELVRNANVVISLLPVPMHPSIAEMCIENKTDLVTASYESEAMRALDKRAKEVGVTMLNEVGLDPGLDHMSVMRIIDDIHDRGGQVVTFSSLCGGLPEMIDNPLKYKFSWSPSGVISASQTPARYRWEDHVFEIDGKELLQNAAPFIGAWHDLRLECLPNRDSLSYESVYGLDNCRTMFRGTLRHKGFSSLMNVFQNMGFFENIMVEDAKTWQDVLEKLRMSRGGFESLHDFLEACAEEDKSEAIRAKECLDWLGMTDDDQSPYLTNGISYSKDRTPQNATELFCQILEERLNYGNNERDMVLMHHSIGAEFEEGNITEEHLSSLQTFGDRNMSAMCKTVGYTCAAATELVLSGSLKDQPGLLLPTMRQIYNPILESVKREGIVFEETCKVSNKGSNRSSSDDYAKAV